MKTLPLKISVSLVALFSLGVATGYVLGHRPTTIREALVTMVDSSASSATNQSAASAAGAWRSERIASLKKSLALSPEQLASVETHFDELSEDYQNLRMDTRAKMGEAIARMNKGIAKELTPEQRRLFWLQIRERSQRASE